jgi:hypothetical protein
MPRKKQEVVVVDADGASVKRERRYSVSFEHFEAAMLTEATLTYQLYERDRYHLDLPRRQKIAGMLKRFVAELAPELAAHKERVRAYQEAQAGKPDLNEASSLTRFPNGD